MQTLIMRWVQNFEFQIPNSFTIVPKPNITVRSKNGIQLFVKLKTVN